MTFSRDIFKIDAEYEAEQVQDFLLKSVRSVPKRDGIIVGISGGIDSAVVASLSARAVGKERVFGLILPDMPDW